MQKETPEAPKCSVALAPGQDVRGLCTESVSRPSQAEGLPAFDCLYPESVRHAIAITAHGD